MLGRLRLRPGGWVAKTAALSAQHLNCRHSDPSSTNQTTLGKVPSPLDPKLHSAPRSAPATQRTRVVRDRLMDLASEARRPVDLLFFSRSLPARSTRNSLPTWEGGRQGGGSDLVHFAQQVRAWQTV